jgi:lipopolysaccharide/colanic/teichoic acid biosynthesis glycosyltransferase
MGPPTTAEAIPTTLAAPALPRNAAAAKRAFDVAVALLALVVLLPLLVLVALSIKLDSRGPVLFVQRRVGRGGRLFRLYKFRTMHRGAPLLVGEDGAIVKQRVDPRVTRLGRILRRLSLDEAPQLVNVLRGEMSVVGPRPLVPAEAATLSDRAQLRRSAVRPGITGPWQVSGRSQIPLAQMLELDELYIAGWSIARDVRILLATLPAVLSGRGAY